MIEKTLRTTTGKLRVSIPTQLDEITLRQLIAMQEKPNLSDIDAISILSGIATDEIKNIRDMADLNVFADHVQTLAFQIKHLYNSDAIPKKIIFTIDDKQVQVSVSNNLAVEPVGAFMASRDLIAEEIARHIDEFGEDDWKEHFSPSLKACSQVLAQFFYCRATGNAYDEYKADDFVNEVKKLRVTEALPIAKHFFMNYPDLSKPRTGFWHRLRRLWKSGQVYRRLKSSNTSIPSMPLPAAT